MSADRLRGFWRAHWQRLLFFAVLLAVFFGNRGFRSLIANWLELRALSREIQVLESENDQVVARLRQLRDSDAALEREARKMGFIKSGEIEYRFDPPKPPKK